MHSSLNMIISRSIHIAANGISHSLLWLRNTPFTYTFLIHSSVDGHLGCFQVLAIKNRKKKLGWILWCLYLFKLVFIFFGYMSRSGIAGSYGNSYFSFFKESPYYFHILSEIPQRHISFDITYMWNLFKNDTNELIYKTNRLTDIKRNIVTKKKGVGGWIRIWGLTDTDYYV